MFHSTKFSALQVYLPRYHSWSPKFCAKKFFSNLQCVLKNFSKKSSTVSRVWGSEYIKIFVRLIPKTKFSDFSWRNSGNGRVKLSSFSQTVWLRIKSLLCIAVRRVDAVEDIDQAFPVIFSRPVAMHSKSSMNVNLVSINKPSLTKT